MTAPRIQARDLRKAFGRTRALAGVSLAVDAGEVHALVGENGAGKTTLLKLLSGAWQPDGGDILLDGEPYRPRDPAGARRLGVGMVYQELSLAPHLTVEENLLLGIEETSRGVLRRRAMRERARRVLDEVGHPELDVNARVADLPPAYRQLVEIGRALAQPSCRVIIFDEPTSSLASDDVSRLFGIIRKLRNRGLAILYVSHFLEEVRQVADRYTVLRDGRTTGTGRTADRTAADLVRLMVGRDITEFFPRSPREPGEVVLDLEDLAGVRRPERATLHLRRGEVLGIGGLVGAGRTELLRAVFGLDPVRHGIVRVGLYAGPASPTRRLAQGVGLVSEDRAAEGLALGLTVSDNVTLTRLEPLGPGPFVLPRAQASAAHEQIRALGIRCDGPDQPVWQLSGGNQQKVALARLLHHDVDAFLLDEPTRGIDVASKTAIYELIDRLARAGKSVLLVSSSLAELIGVCDRIAVMSRGRLGEAHAVSDVNEHTLLLEATGPLPDAPPESLGTA